MLQFLEPHDATLTTFTGRTERHGEEDIPAVSFGIKITGPNTLLDLLSSTLRTTLYAAVEGQPQLPGVEESTPLLRSKELDTIPLDISYEGWTVTVKHGIADDADIVLGDSKVDVQKVRVFDGGTVEVYGRVGSSDVDAREAGLLWSKQKQQIALILKAPEPIADAIDGSTAAFEADHPDQGTLLDGDAQAHDATDAFVRSAGDEGLDAGVDVADVDGDADVQDDDHAAFEAGARASLGQRVSAGVEASRRRMRAGGAAR